MKRNAILAGAMALSGCIGGENEQTYDTDIVWHLTRLNGQDMAGSATLQFTQDGIAGKGTCNRFRAEQKAEYPAFELGPVAATRRACLEDMGDENDYFKALEQVDTALISDDRLVLTGANGQELVFTVAPQTN